MTANEYPGFGGMIKEFEDILILWWMDGSPKRDYQMNYRVGGFATSLDAQYFPRFRFHRTYDVKRSGFLLLDKTTIEEDRLQAYCKKNGLTYSLNYWSNHVSVTVEVPSYETLKKSALMKRIREIYQWLGAYIPMAQKFADLSLMNDIRNYQTEHYLGRGEIYPWGIDYPSTSDAEGYTSGSGAYHFKDSGYRNLQSEEEMIAFMLAYYAQVEWKKSPIDLDLYGIRWHYYDNPDMSQAICITPSYYVYDPLTYQPVVAEPQLKDFF